jgi:hypothetical protein
LNVPSKSHVDIIFCKSWWFINFDSIPKNTKKPDALKMHPKTVFVKFWAYLHRSKGERGKSRSTESWVSPNCSLFSSPRVCNDNDKLWWIPWSSSCTGTQVNIPLRHPPVPWSPHSQPEGSPSDSGSHAHREVSTLHSWGDWILGLRLVQSLAVCGYWSQDLWSLLGLLQVKLTTLHLTGDVHARLGAWEVKNTRERAWKKGRQS